MAGFMAGPMAGLMAAMMLPTAAPFLVAYARDVRRPEPVAAVAFVYALVWAAIGLGIGWLMGQVMLPAASLPIAAAAVLFAGLYALTPWFRWARARCREMCRERHERTVRAGLRSGAAYSGSCIVCSAGVMVALVLLGMSNLLLVAAAAAVILLMKLDTVRT